jgi:hypothetical protein
LSLVEHRKDIRRRSLSALFRYFLACTFAGHCRVFCGVMVGEVNCA